MTGGTRLKTTLVPVSYQAPLLVLQRNAGSILAEDRLGRPHRIERVSMANAFEGPPGHGVARVEAGGTSQMQKRGSAAAGSAGEEQPQFGLREPERRVATQRDAERPLRPE